MGYFFEDIAGRLGPDERLWVGIVVFQVFHGRSPHQLDRGTLAEIRSALHQVRRRSPALKWRQLRYACIAPCSRHKRSKMATATGYDPRFSPFARISREWKQSAVGIEAPPAQDQSWIAPRDVVTARFWASRQSRKSLPSTPVRESSGVSRLTGYRSSLSWRSSRLSRLSSSPRRSAPPRRIGGRVMATEQKIIRARCGWMRGAREP